MLSRACALCCACSSREECIPKSGAISPGDGDTGLTIRQANLLGNTRSSWYGGIKERILTELESQLGPEKLRMIKAQIEAVENATSNAKQRQKAYNELQNSIDSLELGALGNIILMLLSGQMSSPVSQSRSLGVYLQHTDRD